MDRVEIFPPVHEQWRCLDIKISFFTHRDAARLNTGFGYAGSNIVNSLKQCGHDIPFDDPSAPVQICFTNPTHAKFHNNQFKILFMPWESTSLKPGWLQVMNSVDEVWTPSDLIKVWFKNAGVRVPIKVYQHGVSEIWSPRKRKIEDNRRMRFLHHGAEASRKCGQVTLNAFLEVFSRNNDNVCLTFKSSGPPPIRVTQDGQFMTADKYSNNIKLITNEFELHNLVGLYHMNDVMVGISSSEGFGLTALQAMATGMPTIINPTWAPYRKFTVPELRIEDRLIRSPWPSEHPGMVLEPNFNQICESMEYAYNNFDVLAAKAFEIAPQIHKSYSWDDLTEQAFEEIVEKFG